MLNGVLHYRPLTAAQGELTLVSSVDGGNFVFWGGTGYATHVNGTYEVVDGETVNGKPVFRQIENPLNWFEYVVSASHKETRDYLMHFEKDAATLLTHWLMQMRFSNTRAGSLSGRPFVVNAVGTCGAQPPFPRYRKCQRPQLPWRMGSRKRSAWSIR